VTKDRPRNRSGGDGKSGGFRGGPRGGGPRSGGPTGPSRGADRGPDRGRDRSPAPPPAALDDAAPDRAGDTPWASRTASRSEQHDRPTKTFDRADRPPGRGSRPPTGHGQGSGPRTGQGSGKPYGKSFSKPAFGKPDRKSFDRPHADRPPSDRPHSNQPRTDRPRQDRSHSGASDGGRQRAPQFERRESAFEDGGEVWIWGIHAAGAVLANPDRLVSRALLTRNAAEKLGLDLDALPAYAQILEAREIDQRVPAGAVHQGVAVRAPALEPADLNDFVIRPERPLVILDSVTDPQNVGAVLRSAAAFGVGAVVMQTRNAPALGGALAKAAAGAVERVTEIREVNISRAIRTLTDAGWRVVGLDGSAELTLDEAFSGREPLAIVLGAEGEGLRQGVAAACTHLARIPISADMESLNVSTAAAIAFYEASRRHGAVPPAAKPAARPAADEDADADETD
jgi:23S rRNA (guanosine2251-2'-O)-methyltransferase